MTAPIRLTPLHDTTQALGARYVELPGCGHCPPLEQPQAFLAALKEFVGV